MISCHVAGWSVLLQQRICHYSIVHGKQSECRISGETKITYWYLSHTLVLMTVFQRRRQQSTCSNKTLVVWHIRKFYLISTITIRLVVMLWSCSYNVNRSLQLPFLNAFTLQKFQYHSRSIHRRQHSLHFHRFPTLNIRNGDPSIRQRMNNNAYQRQKTILSIPTTVASSSLSSSSSVAET